MERLCSHVCSWAKWTKTACKLLVQERYGEDIAFFHVLFEIQNEILITRMIGNEYTIRTVESIHFSPHDAYVLGFCVSSSRCLWKLKLYDIGGDHIDMLQQGIASWGHDKRRITRNEFTFGELMSSGGIDHIQSVAQHTLSGLCELDLQVGKKLTLNSVAN